MEVAKLDTIPGRTAQRMRPQFLPHPAFGRVLYGIGGIALFLAVWKAAMFFAWVPANTLPDPFQLPHALTLELSSGRLFPAVGSSMVHYFWGLGVGSLAGVTVGLLAATIRRLDLLQAYLARILRPIPPLAWVVFALAWFKVSHAGAAFVIAIGVFWVNYFATYSAVRNVDPRFYELARAFGHVSYFSRLTSITLPAIAPGAMSGPRAGIGQAWMTLIAAELLGVPGMGQEMNAAAGVGAYDAVIVYMLVISLLYSVCDVAFVLIEKKVLQWRP
jgi:ABC-type nitrate/sulfonate/bicarbonate transport system permease component